MTSNELAYAIDFGTTNSLIVAATRDRVFPPLAVDPRASDPTILRSVLFFSEDTALFACGARALEESTQAGARGRLMRSLKRFLPIESFTETRLGTRRYKLEELVAIVLRNLRERANDLVDADVRRAVIGCPARFSDEPKAHELAVTRLRKAAELAGFNQIELCEEPVAAALERAQVGRPELIAVLDLGGGTSDFTIARLNAGQAEVLAVGGVAIAGDALDGSLMRSCIAPHFGSTVTYRRAFGENVLGFPKPLLERLCTPSDLCLLDRRETLDFLKEIRSSSLGEGDRECMDRLLCLVEDRLGFRIFETIAESKRELSSQEHARFCFDYPSIDLDLPLSRESFEAAALPSFERILARFDETLSAAGVHASEIDGVYCTGGTARVPALIRAVKERFPAHKVRHVSTFHAVIQGLGERARSLLARGALD